MLTLRAILLLSISITTLYASAPGTRPASGLKLPGLFTDHMVLQQKMNIPVWGIADSGRTVRVDLGKQKRTTTAARDGHWRVDFSPLPAGGPYTMRIMGADTITLNDVMVGEVWLCSGQSNMAMPVGGWGQVLNYRQEIAAAKYPQIRLFTVPNTMSFAPIPGLVDSSWQVCSPASVPEFSAAAYFFGRDLYHRLKVPIGLINASWGGTAAEAWTSAASLKDYPPFDELVESLGQAKLNPELVFADYRRRLELWKNDITQLDSGYRGTPLTWNNPDYVDSDWKMMNIPGDREGGDFSWFDGAIWFRKEITLPQGWADSDLVLNLGPIDDEDVTWFNGTKIGSMAQWDQPRRYTIPKALLRNGRNIITVRVLDTGSGGGFWGQRDQVCLLHGSHDSLSLAGSWKFREAMSFDDMPLKPVAPDDPNYPTVLYNGMISRLIPYAIRGVTWYQGEGNASRADQYRGLFPKLITDWRSHWGQGDFPFLFVQLANYSNVTPQPDEACWAELREAQSGTLSVKNTGMAVAIDLGEAGNIHPKNKQEVGKRLALLARNLVYKERVPAQSPAYESMVVDGDRIRVLFNNTSRGLVAKGKYALQGFAIAGEDRRFHWAEAVIEDRKVIVRSPTVPHPVAVRYAWATNPVCNLYNGAGLPASPFRTDTWPLTTIEKKRPSIYTLDASDAHKTIFSGHLKMGTQKNPDGREITCNNFYYLRDGKPWLPTMGEIHFSRYPREEWEDAILKMKAGGIQIISTYVFWNNHEEIEGQFDWTGNKDLRYFIELCKKNGVYAFVRIGPWSHGEMRNGGFPDWLPDRCVPRTNDSAYFAYSRRLYTQIFEQVKRLLFKDGGPIIGIQLENEFEHCGGKGGVEYMMTLKRMAQEIGFDVPFYTATGWGGSPIPQDEIIPVYGGYPDAPWEPGIEELPPSEMYAFYDESLADERIGSDLATGPVKPSKPSSRYPFATAELGAGNQICYLRRPIIGPEDGIALCQARLGTGANLMGYYMFHGGSNPVGELSTLNEPSYPIISYDFQAPIGEFGQPVESYRYLRRLHLFLNDFGDRLAPAVPVIPAIQPTGPKDTRTLRYAARVKDDGGFLFLNNYQRSVTMRDLPDLRFELRLREETLRFPRETFTLKKDVYCILPFNFPMGSILLKYAMAQPLCRIEGDTASWFFFAPNGIAPEYAFDSRTVNKVMLPEGSVSRIDQWIIASQLHPGTSCVIEVEGKDGRVMRIITLTSDQALQCVKDTVWGKERLFLSEATLVPQPERVSLNTSERRKASFAVFPDPGGEMGANGNPGFQSKDGIFSRFTFQPPEKEFGIQLTGTQQGSPVASRHPLIGHSWFWGSQDQSASPSWFRKRFTIPTAGIVEARFTFIADDFLKLWVNDSLVGTGGDYRTVRKWDISKHLKAGENILAIAGTSNSGPAGIIGRVDVRLENGSTLSIPVDGTWKSSLTELPGWTQSGFDDTGWHAPIAVAALGEGAWGIPDESEYVQPEQWKIELPREALQNVEGTFLDIDYAGDFARLYLGERLIADNLFNGTTWRIGLQRFAGEIGTAPLILKITPLSKDAKIYIPQDKWPRFSDSTLAVVRSIRVVPEYRIDVTKHQ